MALNRVHRRDTIIDHELRQWLLDNDTFKISAKLAEDPNILFAVDNENRSLLHYILKYSSTDIFKAILKYFYLFKAYDEFAYLLRLEDIDKWSSFHYAVRYSDYDGYQTIVTLLGDDVPHYVNRPLYDPYDDACGPEILFAIDLASENEEDKDKIMEEIYSYMEIKSPPLSSMTSAIDFNLVSTLYQTQNKELLKNLEFGCLAANHARARIQICPTHVAINRFDTNTINELTKQREKMEAVYDEQYYNLCRFDPNPEENNNIISVHMSNMRKCIEESKLGGCLHYAVLVADAVIKMGIGARAECFEIVMGDHVFVVIDRKEGSDENDPRAWGDAAVVVDARSGEVYPASYIFSKLQDFRQCTVGEKKFNFDFPYQQDMHKLRVRDTFKFSPDFFAKQQEIDESVFSSEEVVAIKQAKSKWQQEVALSKTDKMDMNYTSNLSHVFFPAANLNHPQGHTNNPRFICDF